MAQDALDPDEDVYLLDAFNDPKLGVVVKVVNVEQRTPGITEVSRFELVRVNGGKPIAGEHMAGIRGFLRGLPNVKYLRRLSIN